jgi:hypothetical protein
MNKNPGKPAKFPQKPQIVRTRRKGTPAKIPENHSKTNSPHKLHFSL